MDMEHKRNNWIPAVLLGWLLPMLLVNLAGSYMGLYAPVPTIPSGPEDGPTETLPRTGIMVCMEDGTAVKMDLEEYVLGVVLGEMPSSFEDEALKAQAVVARTYTLRRQNGPSKHASGAVCTDPSCCQAYRAPANYLASGGTDQMVQRVKNAVMDTAGLVLTYRGELIEATYFASSGGRTEDALAVWGSDLPYLQAVDSPEEAYEDRYMAQVVFTAQEFEKALGLELTGSPGAWVRSVSYTNGGGVDAMDIGGHVFSGTELRRLLGLRSTAFVIRAEGDRITVVTRGHGHRVGMSQYGAQAMALEGKTFREILAHYYAGTELEECVDIVGNLG